MPQGMAPHPCACGWHRSNSIDHSRTILKIGQAVERQVCPIGEAQKDLEEIVRGGYDQDTLYTFF